MSHSHCFQAPVYNKCINCFFTTDSNLICHYSLAIYATWFLYNPKLKDCKSSFSSKCMNTFFEWNTIWSRILIVKKHKIEEDALEDWFFWSCMQKKRFTEWWPNKSIGVCLVFFFSYRAVNFFFCLSLSLSLKGIRRTPLHDTRGPNWCPSLSGESHQSHGLPDAQWRNRLHCTAENQLPFPNF